MVSKQINCPACFTKSTKKGIRLHVQKALKGFDPVWNSDMPHTKWARSKGIEVTDLGVTFQSDKLKKALDEYLARQ